MAVATKGVHYVSPSGRIVHDVLTRLRHRVTLDEAGTPLPPNGEQYLKPQERSSPMNSKVVLRLPAIVEALLLSPQGASWHRTGRPRQRGRFRGHRSSGIPIVNSF